MNTEEPLVSSQVKDGKHVFLPENVYFVKYVGTHKSIIQAHLTCILSSQRIMSIL